VKVKSVEMCLLFDFYGEILTEKQQELFDLYYNEDMSLAEISENIGITRQGVRDAIVRAEATLTEMEQKIGLVARYGKIQSALMRVADHLTAIGQINENRYRNVEIDRLVATSLSDLAPLKESEGQ